MLRALIAAYLVALLAVSFSHAHDGNPAHDDWFKKLTNANGNLCCDGSDAFSVLDPDWEMTVDPEIPYRVRLGKKLAEQHPEFRFSVGLWLPVHKAAIVNENNIVGVAKVWPVANSRGGKAEVRCFLPGPGA